MAARTTRRFGGKNKDRIFFACVPDAATAERIHALAEDLKRSKELNGNQIRAEHLHVTLFHLGDWVELPDKIVSAALDAAQAVDVPPFDVAFDHTESFYNRTGNYPFVLKGNNAAPWGPLRQALKTELKRVGLGGATEERFTPHMTLLYDERRASPETIPPVSWTVCDFVLVHSLLGKTTHRHLGRWPLQDLSGPV